MEQLNVLIVDDEPDALRLLEELLKNREYVNVVGTAANKQEALRLLIEQAPDVVFQDIQIEPT